jgi:branched-chain amino acid transport system substrate-binding protein
MNRKKHRASFGLSGLVAVLALALPAIAAAQVKVGVTVAATGPAASLGIPERNTVELLPKEVAGQKIEWIVLDDGTDTTRAVQNTRKLATDDNADVIVGTSVTPGSLAMVDVAGELKVPLISVAASSKIVDPVDDKRRWVFKTPQNDALMAGAVAAAMQKNKVKTLGFIGFADAYGDGWLEEIKKAAEPRGIKIVAVEKYGRSDTSVTGQVLKLIQAKPDAVLIAGAGTPSALPQKELRARNYTGAIYQTHGVANNDFLRVCGKDCDGTLLPAGPLLVAEQLPDSNPVKKSGLTYVKAYEQKYGAGSVSTFGGHVWDAGQLIVTAIPIALKTGAKPGTPQFRAALRDAIESIKDLPASQGVFTMSPTDHAGLDDRAHVIVKIQDGKWVYQPGL